MTKRPYVVLSVATSIDGLINDTTPGGLPLSNEADFDRVDQVRADCDAILIGAGTLRGDDPRMTVKSAESRAQRVAAGKTEHPAKVLVTALATSTHPSDGSTLRVAGSSTPPMVQPSASRNWSLTSLKSCPWGRPSTSRGFSTTSEPMA